MESTTYNHTLTPVSAGHIYILYTRVSKTVRPTYILYTSFGNTAPNARTRAHPHTRTYTLHECAHIPSHTLYMCVTRCCHTQALYTYASETPSHIHYTQASSVGKTPSQAHNTSVSRTLSYIQHINNATCHTRNCACCTNSA